MQKPTNCLGVFDQFMELPLKGLTIHFVYLKSWFCTNYFAEISSTEELFNAFNPALM